MVRTFAVFLIAGAALLAAAPPAPAPDADRTDAPRAAPVTGVIEGSVVASPRAPRRTANRYPGTGAGSARTVPPVPAVAYLEGQVAGAAVRAAAPPRLIQRDTSFQPNIAVVPVGTEVAFPNADPFFHNVFSYSRAKRFDLGRYPQGESKSVLFDEPGVIKVFCEIHQWMRAQVVVVENPFHAVVDDDGAFRFTGVPAGSYRLTVVHFDRGTRTVDVEVRAGATARVQVEL